MNSQRLVNRLGSGARALVRAFREKSQGPAIALTRTRVGTRVADRLGIRERSFERAYSSGAWTSTGESRSGDGSSGEMPVRGAA